MALPSGLPVVMYWLHSTLEPAATLVVYCGERSKSHADAGKSDRGESDGQPSAADAATSRTEKTNQQVTAGYGKTWPAESRQGEKNAHSPFPNALGLNSAHIMTTMTLLRPPLDSTSAHDVVQLARQHTAPRL